MRYLAIWTRSALRPAMGVAAMGVLAAPSSVAREGDSKATLAIHLTKLRTAKGRVGCTLYDSPRGFPADASAARQRRWCAIDRDRSDCAFASVEKGIYAVACFHDENANGKLDTGVFGIPREGTVVSNEAKGSFGPPKWDAAKFQFSGTPAQLTLRMSY